MTNSLAVPQWSALPSVLPPERQEYNQLRGRFAVLSRSAMDAFSRDYDAQIKDLDKLVEKASDLANPHILAAIDAAIKLLVAHRVFDIDKEHFTERYLHPYDSWTSAFEHVADQVAEVVHSADELDAYRTARREGRGRIIGGGFGVGGAAKGMAAAGAANLAIGATHAVFNLAAKGISAIGDNLEKSRIFDDPQTKRGLVDALGKSVLAVHLAVLDALAAAKSDAGLQRIPALDEAKAQRMLTNLRQGMLGDAEAGAVLTEILTLNPYLHDAYTHALDAIGDASGELERVAAFFHVDLAGEKKARIRPLIRTNNEEAMRESIRQVKEAGQRLGIAVEDDFLEPLNQRLAKLDRIARTVEGAVYPTREEAQAAEARLKAERAEKVRGVLDKAKRGSIWMVKAVGYTFAVLVALFIVLAIVVPSKEQAGSAESPAAAAALAPSEPDNREPEVLERGELEGVVQDIIHGDYSYLRLVTGDGKEVRFMVGTDLPGDEATLKGKKVRAQYTKQRMWIEEAGVHETMMMLSGLSLVESAAAAAAPADTAAPAPGAATSEPPAVVSPAVLPASATDDMGRSAVIAGIRARFVAINDNQKTLQQEVKTIYGMSSEGAELKSFWKDKALLKLAVTFFGEAGKATTDVYFHNGKVDFVYATATNYSAPERGESPGAEENRYYFDNNRLVWWLEGPDRREADKARYRDGEQDVLSSAEELRLAALTPGSELQYNDGRFSSP